jgi:hypothetical protein
MALEPYGDYHGEFDVDWSLRLLHTSYQQRPAYLSPFRSSQIQSGKITVSHPKFRHMKCQAEIDIDALFEEPYSQNQGTGSPYRVESPSGRVSGVVFTAFAQTLGRQYFTSHIAS